MHQEQCKSYSSVPSDNYKQPEDPGAILKKT